MDEPESDADDRPCLPGWAMTACEEVESRAYYGMDIDDDLRSQAADELGI